MPTPLSPPTLVDHDHDHEYMVPVSILPLAKALSSDRIREQWLCLAKESDNLRAFYQTPNWCQHKALCGERIDVAVVQGASAQLLGVAPLLATTFQLSFAAGKRALWTKPFRGLWLEANQPFLLSTATTTTTMSTWCPTWCPMETYDRLLRVIRSTFPDRDCLYMGSVPLDSFLWKYIESSPEVRSFWQPFLPARGPSRHYGLLLPPTFAEYAAKFPARSLKNLRREANNLRKEGGVVDMVRVDSPEQVAEFVEGATAVAATSWQRQFLHLPLETAVDRARSLRDLADHGLLRSYLLRCGGRPCAYVIGFQLGSTYVYYETAFDPQFVRHGPGQVLLYRVLQDLFSHNKPQRVSFGPGDYTYKSFFGNAVGLETELVLFRRTLSNRAWCGSYRLFQGAVVAAKRLLGKDGGRPGTMPVSVLPLARALSSCTIRAQWLELAKRSDSLYAFYQTPGWCRHQAAAGERIDVAVVQDASDALLGVAPLLDTTFRLSFAVHNRELWTKPFRGLQMLGNQPLLAPTTAMSTWCPTCCPMETVEALFRAIHAGFPDCDCLCMGNVPLDSVVWKYVRNSDEARSLWQPFLPESGPVRHYGLSLPPTLAEYAAGFPARSLKNLERETDSLRKHGGGRLELVRVNAPDEVPQFVESTTAVAASSWQRKFLGLPVEMPLDRARSFRDFANHGLLRAYLLKCGGRPCTIRSIFNSARLTSVSRRRMIPSLPRYSPGRVLLHLILEDLFARGTSWVQPRRLSFGPGDYAYKTLFGNSASLETNLVLFRRTLSNRAWYGAYRLVRGAAYAAKRLLGKKGDGKGSRAAPQGKDEA